MLKTVDINYVFNVYLQVLQDSYYDKTGSL